MAVAGVLLVLAGCGRTGVGRRGGQDAGSTGRVDARDTAGEPAQQAPDAPADTARPADGAAELPERDAAVPERDAAVPDIAGSDVVAEVAAPPDLLPPGCLPLANDGVLNLGRIKQALFAADGSALLVRIGGADSDVKDEARLIQLPGGESKLLGSGIRDVAWLGRTRALLTTADNALVAVTLDGDVVGSSAGPTCSHLATPDGLRVYFTSSVCDRGVGPLAVLDLARGSLTPLATSVSTGSLAVSPDSRWAAYVEEDTTAGVAPLYIVDSAGAATLVPEVPAAKRPTFASGSVLLFQLPNESVGRAVGRYDLDNHDMQALAEGDVGIAGYEMTPDGSVLLVARPVSAGETPKLELYRVTTAGGAPVRVATDLVDYRIYSMVVRAFAFAPTTRRILYLADRSGDAGRATGISSVALDGGTPIELSTGGMAAVMSSHADRVALVAVDRTLGRSTLRVVSTRGEPQFSVDVPGEVSFTGFVPGDRGLLYVQTKTDAALSTSELGHLSFTRGKTTRLGGWQKSALALSNYPVGITAHEYPADPRGCYTVVDSDLDQTGARLVAVPE
jgi:hypothetical protein